jgi:hypothetical protein
MIKSTIFVVMIIILKLSMILSSAAGCLIFVRTVQRFILNSKIMALGIDVHGQNYATKIVPITAQEINKMKLKYIRIMHIMTRHT